MDGFDSSTTAGADRVYVSDADGDLPANSVSDATIENVPRRIMIPSHEMNIVYDGGGVAPTETQVGSAPALAFSPTTDNRVDMATRIPDDWAGIGSLLVVLHWSPAVSGGGMVWSVNLRSVAAGEAVDAGGFTASFSPSIGGLTANVLHEDGGLISAATNFSPGDMLFLSISRDADHVGDSNAGLADLYAISINYTATQ